MIIRLLLVPVLILFTTISMAQEVPGAVEKKKDCGCGYSALYSIGVLQGDEGGQLQLQTIQGIRYGKWFSGLGVGLDYYHLRGIPVFLDIRRTLTSKKHSPFVYADGGMHFAWPEKDQKQNGSISTEFKNGLYYDMGIGMRFTTGKQSAFLLSAGYSHKFQKEIQTSPLCLNWNCDQTTTETYKFSLNRLSLKIGMQF